MQSRKPAGSPNGTGGQYDHGNDMGADDLTTPHDDTDVLQAGIRLAEHRRGSQARLNTVCDLCDHPHLTGDPALQDLVFHELADPHWTWEQLDEPYRRLASRSDDRLLARVARQRRPVEAMIRVADNPHASDTTLSLLVASTINERVKLAAFDNPNAGYATLRMIEDTSIDHYLIADAKRRLNRR